MSPALKAHQRLSETLPKRTYHSRRFGAAELDTRKSKRVSIKGREYPSISAACTALRVDANAIKRLIAKGEGRYV